MHATVVLMECVINQCASTCSLSILFIFYTYLKWNTILYENKWNL